MGGQVYSTQLGLFRMARGRLRHGGTAEGEGSGAGFQDGADGVAKDEADRQQIGTSQRQDREESLVTKIELRGGRGSRKIDGRSRRRVLNDCGAEEAAVLRSADR